MTSNTTITPESLFGEARENWGWLLALGIGSLILGSIGLGSCFALTLAGVLLFGWLIAIAGVIELVQVFKCRGWKGRLGQLAIAAFHLLAGGIVIADPVLASGVFTLILAFAILAGGAARIVVALQHRGQPGWAWMVLGGFAGVVLGALIAARWPASSFFVIGLFIAIELIANGWTMVVLALAARSADSRAPVEQPA
jgi:uncharacterized membrane protein HdeD (DUF308 family)